MFRSQFAMNLSVAVLLIAVHKQFNACTKDAFGQQNLRPRRRIYNCILFCLFTLATRNDKFSIIMPTLVGEDVRNLTTNPGDVRSSASSTPWNPILILGAGPAGLSLGVELKRRNIPFLIVEKGNGPGESWRNMPRNLKLVSPWKTNFLPGTRENLFARHAQLSREEYYRYLREYAQSAQLPIETQTEIETIEKLPNNEFRVQTSRGDFLSNIVVNATGYFSNPFVPSIPGASRSQIPQLHFADYCDPDQLRSKIPSQVNEGSPLVLIVGKRLSAGQVMVELVEAGFAVALSHRTPIQFGAEPWAWWFLFRLFPSLEWLKLKSKGSRAPSNDVRMQGGFARKLIESGALKTFPSISRFEDTSILFENGQQLRPNLVLYATGFRPALSHLSSLDLSFDRHTGRPQLHDLESVSVSGLFFLGLDHGRNFQSRFIRGIRKDAAFLAKRLERRPTCKPCSGS